MLQPSRNRFEVIVRGADGQQLARCLIRRGRYILGQERKNEIVINDPSVSGLHARLTVVEDDKLFIEDLDSANGTSVDGVSAMNMTPVALDSIVELGNTTLEFQRAGLPAAVFDYLPEGFLRDHRYTFGDVVVQGSTSTIYTAHDTSLGREVAIKVMRPESQAQAPVVLRFLREAQVTSGLQHPNILPIYELGLNEQSQLYYTTRFVEGESLAAVLDEIRETAPGAQPRHSLAHLLTVFQKACDAIAYAHSCGVVHGAVSAGNVTSGAFGEVFVVNWSLAKVLRNDANGEPFAHGIDAPPALEAPGLSVTSAPEQASDTTDDVNARTDIYALGALLYRILTLQDAITAANEDELLEKILTGSITPPATLARQKLAPHWPGGRLPEFLAAVAMQALSTAPDDRQSSVHELQQQVAAWQHGQGAGDASLWKQFTGLLHRR